MAPKANRIRAAAFPAGAAFSALLLFRRAAPHAAISRLVVQPFLLGDTGCGFTKGDSSENIGDDFDDVRNSRKSESHDLASA